MSHELPSLPYAYDALEPHIDARTMEIHHGKHHAAYVAKLNQALEGQAGLSQKTILELIGDLSSVPEAIRTAVRNNGGGHFNHDLFWKTMKKGGGGQPKGELLSAIEGAFGSFDALKEAFSTAAANRFGSGWAWLSVRAGKLQVGSTANQDSPIMERANPILGLDVWEHAYYLKYQNRRPDYVQAWWNVVDWDRVTENYARSK